jgi:ankyrin repeat protein
MLLLESAECRCTLLESDVYGQLPLHAACRNGAHPDVIDLLLRYDEGKSTVMREDHVG